MRHDSIAIVAGDLEAAVREHQDAQAAVGTAQEQARQLVADARARVEDTRHRLAEAIVEAARDGMRQRDIVAITGYNRERVRQIVRAAGIEASD